ncbi:MAG: DNA adenine methylase [Candidatus Zixiibacteriota bacterium]
MIEALSKVWNVSQVPQRSPFRYPGGKTWLVPHVRSWLSHCKPNHLIEPFCGGASVGLTAAFEGLTEKVTLVELDDDVAAVWRTILEGDVETLVRQITQFEITRESVALAIQRRSRSLTDHAFATILKNRVQHGGIIAPGASLMKNGENSKGLRSRWYPETLRRRIEAIAFRRDRLSFVHGDAFGEIRRYLTHRKTAFFIDPPYTVAGKRLYLHSQIDHGQLFALMRRAHGPVLMTYDRSAEIYNLASKHGFMVEEVAMTGRLNTEKYELLIGNDLSWLSGARTPQSPALSRIRRSKTSRLTGVPAVSPSTALSRVV